MGFADDMQEAEETFAETEPAKGGGGIFSDGRHSAIIEEFRLEEGTYGWQLIWKFRGRDSNTGQITSGRRWDDMPPSEERMQYVKADLELLGFKGPLSGLEEFCVSEAAIGLVCTIFVKTKPGDKRDYTNIYLNGCTGEKVDLDDYLASLGASPEQMASVSNGFDADDDIPF